MLDPNLGRFDLHMHSNRSDGTLTPGLLMERAAEAGVHTLALTDHDTLAGFEEASAAAETLNIELISGIELTALWKRRVIHLVGLNFDPFNPAFEIYLQRLNRLRAERANKIIERLLKQGVTSDLIVEVKNCAECAQVGRPHIAQALMNLGVTGTFQEAFDRFLGAGRPGDIKVEWPDYTEAIQLIKKTGGLVILAHPTKYKLTFTKIRELMTDLRSAGADGLEVSYPGVSPGHLNELQKLASKLECYTSAGSDFHSPEQRWTALGRYPVFDTQRLILQAVQS